MAETTYIETSVKAQPIRLLDVFVIGPLMVVGGVMLWKRSKLVAAPLASFGVLTVLYNAMNYFKVKETEDTDG